MSVSLPQQWLEKATEDLAVARLVLAEEHTSHACFLSQQCEKALKGYLLEQANTYPRTHKLVDLLGECLSLDSTFNQFESACIRIDEYYYIPTRYPDSIPGSGPEGVPGRAKAEAAVAAAEDVLNFVKDRLL